MIMERVGTGYPVSSFNHQLIRMVDFNCVYMPKNTRLKASESTNFHLDLVEVRYWIVMFLVKWPCNRAAYVAHNAHSNSSVT